MAENEQTRWQQRLESFGKALAQLESACAQGEYSELERAGLVQVFEFSFELASKTVKDRLYREGFETRSPREAIRQGFEAAYLSEDDAELLLDALDKRNLLTHTYDERIAHEAEILIREHYAPALRRLHDALHRTPGS